MAIEPSGPLNPPKGKEGCRDGVPRVARDYFTEALEGSIPKSGMLLWEVISQKNTNRNQSKHITVSILIRTKNINKA